MANIRKAQVLVADAEAVARLGMVQLINSHALLCVCGEADSLPMARELAAKRKPEVIVCDPWLGEGLAFIADIPRWAPGARVVVFTSQSDALSVQRAFQAGACGFVTRRDPAAALLGAIVGALKGERHIGPRVESVLLEGLARGAMGLREGEAAALSNRELQIFHLLGQGLGTRAVATELRVSVKTVETHRQRIKEKLHVSTGTELQRRAVLFHGASLAPIAGG